MSEVKRAAVVKRGADRDHRDMFASRPADLGSVKQTLRPPPRDFGGVAARNETSVLFTVDALRGAARMNTPEPEPAPLSSAAFVGSDDEGVIDLKALSSAPPNVGARSMAPLFSETPPAAFTADVDAYRAGELVAPASLGGFKLGKRALAGIAAAAVALVLCSIGLAAAFKGEEPVVHATAAMQAAPVTPAAPIVTAAPAPPPAPVIAASTSSSTDDAEEAAPVVKGKKGKKKKGKGKGSFAATKVQSSGVASSKTSSEPLVSKPAPKAVDKCRCKGDFNCILRCTAKGS